MRASPLKGCDPSQRGSLTAQAAQNGGRIGQLVTKSDDDGLITYEQLEIIVNKRREQRGEERAGIGT